MFSLGLVRFLIPFFLFGAVFFVSFQASVFAQGGFEIARTYVITSAIEPQFGDIVVFDRNAQQFVLASSPADENLFGVIVEDPLLVLESDNGGLPIVESGEAVVNVTAQNGAISAGDYITSSNLPGKGQKADDEHTYIVGIALEPFSGDLATTSSDTVVAGPIRVLLSIGTQEQAAEQFEEQRAEETGITEATLLNVIQYFLAAFIAIGSIYIAFKNFSPNLKDGLVSIGRNPLAKSSIQSMIVLNAVLIVLISLGGLAVGLIIILLPI